MRSTYWFVRCVFLSMAWPWLFISIAAAGWQPFEWHWALRLLWIFLTMVFVLNWPKDPRAK